VFRCRVSGVVVTTAAAAAAAAHDDSLRTQYSYPCRKRDDENSSTTDPVALTLTHILTFSLSLWYDAWRAQARLSSGAASESMRP
jgi:hypothetical protein